MPITTSRCISDPNARRSLTEEDIEHSPSPLAIGGSGLLLRLTVSDADAVGRAMEACGAEVIIPIEARCYGPREGVNGHEGFPVGGQVVSPGAVGCCPRGRPWGFPMGGRVFPRSFGQGLHPLSVECVFESDRFALGDDDVGVVEEPVNEGAGDRFVHELVEA